MGRDRDGGGPPSDELREAFEVLGNQTRLEALWAIWDAEADVVAFSTIQEGVSVTDSGNLAYHLDRLTGRFVAHRDDGYSLLPAGFYVVHIVTTGYLRGASDVDAVAIGDACPACEGALEFSYQNTYAAVSCPDCERVFTQRPMPPVAVASRGVAGAVATLNTELRSDYRRYLADVCSFCQSSVERTVVPASDAESLELLEHFDEGDGPTLRFQCRNCEATGEAPAGVLLFWVPAAVAFFDDHGVDLGCATIWDAAAWSRGGSARVDLDTGVLRIAVERGQGRLCVEFDEDLGTQSVTRTRTV